MALGEPWNPLAFVVIAFLACMAVLAVTGLDGEAAGLTDDYEWSPDRLVSDAREGQELKWTVEDHVTGETCVVYAAIDDYMVSYPYPDRLVVATFNASDRTFSTHLEIGYDYWISDCAVHDGQVYWLAFDQYGTHLRLKVDDDPTSQLIGDMYSVDRVNGWGARIVDITEESVQVVAMTSYGTPYGAGAYNVVHIELFEVDRESFDVERRVLLSSEMSKSQMDMQVHNGVLYATWTAFRPEGMGIHLFTYEPETSTSRGPMLLYVSHDAISWPNWEIVPESQGNIQLRTSSRETWLRRFNETGAPLGAKNLTSELAGAEGYNVQLCKMLFNGSDVGYIVFYDDELERMRHVTVTADYRDLQPARDVVDASYDGSYLATVTSGDGVLLVWQSPWENTVRLHYVCQTPLSPDLEVFPESFSLLPRGSTDEPLRFGFSVRNVGRGACLGFSVEVYHMGEGAEGPQFLTSLVHSGLFGPDGTVDLEFNATMPSGSHQVRLVITGTLPFEHELGNNEHVIWFLAPNNPPQLEVIAPEEGDVTDVELVVRGVTSDLDGPEGVLTTVTGPFGLRGVVSGTGEWEVVLDLSEVPSGDYTIRVLSRDEEDSSAMVVRSFRVDHGHDTLDMLGAEPDGDVTLLLDESQVFTFAAVDRFGRAVDYTWSIDGEDPSQGSSSFIFDAIQTGEFDLSVEASNGFATLEGRWNVTVLRPLLPTLVGPVPGSDVSVRKGEVVVFSVELENPDGQDLEVGWNVVGGEVEDGTYLSRSVRYPASGTHHVTAFATSKWGTSTVGWTVTVANRAPELSGAEPGPEPLVITNDTLIAFSVSATDGDGDVLTYVWSSTLAEIEGGGGASLEVLCPCSEEGDYTVSVTISDGEDTISVQWSIVPEPPEEPEEPGDPEEPEEPDGPGDDGKSQDGAFLSTGTHQLALVAATVVVIASIVSVYIVRRRRGGGVQ